MSRAHRAWRVSDWSAAGTWPRMHLPRSCTSAEWQLSDSYPGSSLPPVDTNTHTTEREYIYMLSYAVMFFY